MNFTANNIYHIYNRGNQKQLIFLKEDNYIYFLHKTRKFLSPTCDILAYVLMPNHFHFLIHANNETEKIVYKNTLNSNPLSEGIRLLLSTYTQGINKQEGRVGNLVQQNTKSKCINDESKDRRIDYATTCFHYIHQNPLKAGLVDKIEDWQYSSYRDYAGLRQGSLCDQHLAGKLLNIPRSSILVAPSLAEESLKHIW